MKVSEKKQGIQDSIANMKSSPITKSQSIDDNEAELTITYEASSIVYFIYLSSGCTAPLDLVIEHII